MSAFLRKPIQPGTLIGTCRNMGRTSSSGSSTTPLAQPTPWRRFAAYLEGLCALQTADDAISDVVTGSQHASAALAEACDESYALGARLIADAQADGSLRGDVSFDDVYTAYWLNARVCEHADANAAVASRRHIAIVLDGLRAKAASPLPDCAHT
jgi:hypothetical protein